MAFFKPRRKKDSKRVLRKPIEKIHFEFLLEKIDELEKCDILKFNKKLLNVLLYFTGMRASEALLLDKKNIIELLEKGKYNIYCQKTKEYRWLYLNGSTKDNFLTYFTNDFYDKLHDKGIVNKWENKLTIEIAERWMEPYFKLLNQTFGGNVSILKGNCWGLHSYRINFINQIIRVANIDDASHIIGHKTIASTITYFRRMDKDEVKINNILKDANF